MWGFLVPRIRSMYWNTCRKPIGVTLIIMKKASESGREMTIQFTIDKLRELQLSAMAGAFGD